MAFQERLDWDDQPPHLGRSADASQERPSRAGWHLRKDHDGKTGTISRCAWDDQPPRLTKDQVDWDDQSLLLGDDRLSQEEPSGETGNQSQERTWMISRLIRDD